jgi:hypothetical protein
MHIALSNTVGRFKTSQYHPTSVQISWAVIQEDFVAGYIVQIEGPDSTREIPIRNKYRTSVSVSDLSPSTQYTFKVIAVKGIDKITHPTKILYAHMYTVSGAPGELKVSHSLPTSAQLSWTPVPEDRQNDTITGYSVRVVEPCSIEKQKAMDGNATSYEVSDLRPYTTYTFSVSAITKIGTGLTKKISSTTPEGGEVFTLCNNRVMQIMAEGGGGGGMGGELSLIVTLIL